MPQSYSAALPTAHVVLRLLVAVNWLYGAAVLALLVSITVAERWTMNALGISATSEI